jgi:K+-transporting ATPase KdpF subunit
VRTAAESPMTALYWIVLVVTLGLLAYLLYAMLKAEDF